MKLLAISIGAILGALSRYYLGSHLNTLYPTIPLGTLAANLIGGLLMGIMMGLIKNFSFLPEVARLTIMTGFLASLTTFSTFSAETVSLLSSEQYLASFAMIILHVGGSLLATILGQFIIKTVIF